MRTDPADLERFLQHQANVANAYNNASAAERKNMNAALGHLKALRVASVGGLRGLFPSLKGKLQVTKEVLKEEMPHGNP